MAQVYITKSCVLSVTGNVIDATALSVCGTYTLTGGNGSDRDTCLSAITTTFPSANNPFFPMVRLVRYMIFPFNVGAFERLNYFGRLH